MNTDRDLTPMIRSWLHEDAHEDANRVLDLVLDQLDDIHQRRRLWRAPTFRRVNMSYRLGIAAAVILIVAILGLSYVNHEVGSDQPTPTPTPSGTLVPLPSAGAIAPGTYFLANPDVTCFHGCAAYQQIDFSLPAGWAISGGLVYKHLNQPDEVAFSAWTVDQVYADPCHWQGSALSQLDLSNHTHDTNGAIVLAPEDGGLAHQAGRNPSPLSQVTLGGVGALMIKLSVPAQLDIASCDRGEYRSWTEWNVVDGADSHNAPGQVDVVYMVDVDRRPLVIDASHMPAASAADLAELETVLASMTIDVGGSLSAGTYSLPSSFPVKLTYEVPAGWSPCSQGPVEEGVCSKATGVGFLIVDNVVADPCGSATDLLDPPVGPSVEDLVAAISNLRGFRATSAVDITIDGFRGKEFTVTAPNNSGCDLKSWATATRANGVGPGEANLIQVLDVNGVRLAITAAYSPAQSSQADLSALMKVVASVHIGP